MGYFTDTYEDIEKRLNDWLIDEGGNVTDLALDLLNRAQKSLWNAAPWEYLIVDLALTLNASRAVVLPVGFGKVIDVYHDSDGDGRPDFHYYKDGRLDNGYTIRDSFSKASGHSFTMTFFASPSVVPHLLYQKQLDDFAGTGTEYSYFPGDLLLLQAQFIHLTDAGVIENNEYKPIVSRYEREMHQYKVAHQWVNEEMRVIVNDDSGVEIATDQYSLDGGSDGILDSNRRDPSYDRG